MEIVARTMFSGESVHFSTLACFLENHYRAWRDRSAGGEGQEMLNKVVGYIQGNFLTLRKLAERTGATEESILYLVESQCIPRHSYEITESTTVTSTPSRPIQRCCSVA